MGNAIKSSLHGAALKSKEGARSIQVDITPTSSRISRNAVTSLSIRGHRWKRHGETHTHTHTHTQSEDLQSKHPHKHYREERTEGFTHSQKRTQL